MFFLSKGGSSEMKEELDTRLTVDNSKFLTMKLYLYLFIKRVFDIIVSLIGCIVLIPIMIIIKIVSVINKDYVSIIYTQNRIGKNGKEFKLYKFRSMIPNADEELKKILKEDKKLAKEYKKNKKLKKDPRITKVGHMLRKTSIDELPQMFNVLRGEMSLIGNRPYLPREKEDMGKYFNVIVKTKPGASGLWQTTVRSNSSFEERLKIEKYYSEHYGLKMDVKIFFKTIVVVFKCTGAK